jgi:type I restriction enzyme S subunit
VPKPSAQVVRQLSGSEIQRFNLSKGDLLFARRSLVAEGAGKCIIVMEVDGPTTFESSIIRARPDTAKSEPLFLYYFFNSDIGLHLLDTIRRHVAVAGITGGDLSRLEIPIPPLAEQRAVARILGALDDKIDLNRRMNETLEAMARALFKSWFVDFDPIRARAEGRDPELQKHLIALFPRRFQGSALGQIPEGWRVYRWRELVTLEYGKSLSGYENDEGP